VTKSDSYRNGAASVLLSGHPLNPLKTGAWQIWSKECDDRMFILSDKSTGG
jgi:hypothetical protein